MLAGVWFGLSRSARHLSVLSIELLRPVPSVALIPLAMLLFVAASALGLTFTPSVGSSGISFLFRAGTNPSPRHLRCCTKLRTRAAPLRS